jgi:hypothetical protein
MRDDYKEQQNFWCRFWWRKYKEKFLITKLMNFKLGEFQQLS